ncbi:hypothetical protein HK096_001076, partial [Nowakowskiella sp. JEL0078]
FIEITQAYLPLSVITFGGTQAHFAILFDLFVTKRQWVDDNEFAELFAISNSLPGPASTKVAYAIAVIRGGLFLGVYSFLLWSLPGGVFMALVGLGVSGLGKSLPLWVQAIKNGLVAAALGLVTLAAYKLGKKLVTDRITQIINLVSLSLSINLYKEAWLFPVLMVFGGLTTFVWEKVEPLLRIRWLRKKNKKNKEKLTELEDLHPQSDDGSTTQVVIQTDEFLKIDDTKITDLPLESAVSRSVVAKNFTILAGLLVIALWLAIFVVSIVLRLLTPYTSLWNVFGTFFFVGSIIFGGGPVAVPLLQGYVTQSNWLTNSEFLIGYAIISALPGPMFNFAAFCGVLALRGSTFSILGAFLAWIGLFAPGVILQTGVIPFWIKYRSLDAARTVFKGVNAAAAGLLFAAVYLLSKSAIDDKNIVNYPFHLVITFAIFVFCGFLGLPSPVGVLIGGVIGILQWLVVGMPV